MLKNPAHQNETKIHTELLCSNDMAYSCTDTWKLRWNGITNLMYVMSQPGRFSNIEFLACEEAKSKLIEMEGSQRASRNFDVESTSIFRRRFFNAFSTLNKKKGESTLNLKFWHRFDVELTSKMPDGMCGVWWSF